MQSFMSKNSMMTQHPISRSIYANRCVCKATGPAQLVKIIFFQIILYFFPSQFWRANNWRLFILKKETQFLYEKT